ncbi:MAG: SDR family NAD(P)-dependent oxidoreductase [Spirochaetaceae bacterium]|jgi:NAD(P)-dependent dehydrogenase (short-subunit alcohol dehydrogenase family)|nr:SDR family NAD(P)-dependent oxidoreductase [Spirochaetaceae bacterium]
MMKNTLRGRVVLVTGASSGIGAAAALLFAERGSTVYCASRRGILPGQSPNPDSGPGQAGILYPLSMDLTSDAAVTAGVEAILRREGRLDVLVHAAGDGLAGPIEVSAAEDAARQMDVNYFGALRLLGAALPAMRKQGEGRIILVGSVGGIFSIPFQTLYSSSKAALTMLSDGLRLELRPFNIQCSVILPGDVKTGFTAARRYVRTPCPEAYQQAMKRAISVMERDEQGGMGPEKAARVIVKTAEANRPRARLVVGGGYRVLVMLNRLLPYSIVEKLIRLTYLK